MTGLSKMYTSEQVTNILIRIGAIAGLTVTIMVGFLVYTVVSLGNPALRFTQDEYPADIAILCPGDKLSYLAQVIVYRSPLAPTIVKTWWDVNSNSQIEERQLSLTDIQVWIGRPVFAVDLPVEDTIPNFAPGNYEQRGAIRINLLYASAYKVKFVIPDNCARPGRTTQ